MKNKNWLILGAAAASAAAAYFLFKSTKVSIPKGAKAVSPFDVNRFMGTWYEIARLDYRFERHLSNVSATYSINENGQITVDNKGYDTRTYRWKESIGKADFVDNPEEARLKVSFFGPFYAGYNVIDIDEKYQHALVAGNNLNYIWILSRNRTIPEAIKTRFLAKAEELGYHTDDLIWTKHDSYVA
ncbi:lipocalin family protein [Chitinophaga arvensicola]|uniref:Outer membrane lipoprotein Blc n=1 Tax=Chitinophaga arvensicola TaxID=29529 RepID=A0A1I0S839_9BACT|nr:lipocalin family protein [Chitinophaga arvensicola]SEW52067.1 apolipoprotein D and lipocalin family protein [Chitinophaga arvensicola]